MWTFIIAGAIFLYSFQVIRKSVHQIKNGQYCSGCGEGTCSTCQGCNKKEIVK